MRYTTERRLLIVNTNHKDVVAMRRIRQEISVQKYTMRANITEHPKTFIRHRNPFKVQLTSPVKPAS